MSDLEKDIIEIDPETKEMLKSLVSKSCTENYTDFSTCTCIKTRLLMSRSFYFLICQIMFCFCLQEFGNIQNLQVLAPVQGGGAGFNNRGGGAFTNNRAGGGGYNRR